MNFSKKRILRLLSDRREHLKYNSPYRGSESSPQPRIRVFRFPLNEKGPPNAGFLIAISLWRPTIELSGPEIR